MTTHNEISVEGITNRQRSFRKGDIIRYAGETFIVQINWGTTGEVLPYPTNKGDERITFRWFFDGEECVLVTPANG